MTTSQLVVVGEAKTANPLQLQSRHGFLSAFDYTLAPYIGCRYGCGYCYVPKILRGYAERRGGWGAFVDRRSRAADLLLRQAAKLEQASIFLSATTDPYQPEEGSALITRAILETLADIPFRFLLISTRSGLVLRDLDILTDERMRHRVEIGLSLPTDKEEYHDQLEPDTSAFRGRFTTARRLKEAGLATRIHAAPLGEHSPDFWIRIAECSSWCWIDGAGHGALEEEPCSELLFDYTRAEQEAIEAQAFLGSARVGYGKLLFAWQWDPATQCIIPPPPRVYLPPPPHPKGRETCIEK